MSVLGGLVPVLALIVLAVAVPKLVARLVPEGVGWLVGNGVISSVALWAVAAGYFAGAYAMQADALTRLLGIDPIGTLAHFVKLGALAGMIWAPVMVLSLASLPKKWVEVVW